MKTLLKSIGKLMSYALRHNPESLNIELDENGWTATDLLIERIKKRYPEMDHTLLDTIVQTNDKKRYAFNADKSKIRANQGHSIQVNLELQAQTPPDILFHGTVEKFLPGIKEKGLIKMSRQHVHLSADKTTATTVGSRRGKPVILEINARQMHEATYAFYCSENGVWLTKEVPSRFITNINNY